MKRKVKQKTALMLAMVVATSGTVTAIAGAKNQFSREDSGIGTVVSDYTVSVAVTGNGKATITSGGSVILDTSGLVSSIITSSASIQLVAAPESVNDEFVGWYIEENKVGIETTYTYDAAEYEYANVTIVAKFEAKLIDETEEKFTVTATAENGTVEGLENGGVYTSGSSVILTATPNEDKDYEFLGWFANGETDAVSNDLTYSFNAVANVDLVAKFEAKIIGETEEKFTVTATAENGIVEGLENGGVYTSGSSVILTATPNEDKDYEFLGWFANGETDAVSTDLIYSFNAVANVDLVAKFEAKIIGETEEKFTVTATAENGTVEGLENGGVYTSGSSVILTATPNEDKDYEFLGWFANGETDAVSNDLTYSFNAVANVDLVAKFEAKLIDETEEKFTVTATAENGTVAGTVKMGDVESVFVSGTEYTTSSSIKLTATPKGDKEYKFLGWFANSGTTPVKNELTYTFSPTAELTLVAKFEEITDVIVKPTKIEITSNIIPGETVTSPIGLLVGETSTITYKITPDNATDQTATFASSDESVATVDENGVVTAKKVGSATITVTAVGDSSVKATTTVNVYNEETKPVLTTVEFKWTDNAETNEAGDYEEFTIVGKDQFGNDFALVGTPKFVVKKGDKGTENLDYTRYINENIFRFYRVGTYTVEITVDNKTCVSQPIKVVDTSDEVFVRFRLQADKFNGMDIANDLESIVITETENRKIKKYQDPVKNGYTFTGWYYDKKCTSLYNADQLLEDVDNDNVVELYAGWKEGSTDDNGDNGDNGNDGGSSGGGGGGSSSGGGSTTTTDTVKPADTKTGMVDSKGNSLEVVKVGNEAVIKPEVVKGAAVANISSAELKNLVDGGTKVVKVDAGFANYSLPTNMAASSKQYADILAKNKLTDSDVYIQVEIKDLNNDTVVTDKLKSQFTNSHLLAAPIEFTVKLVNSKDGKVISELNEFNAPVEREIKLAEGNKLPEFYSAFKLNDATGKFVFIPHVAKVVNGETFVHISSETNSDYVIVENAVQFNDVNNGQWYTEFVQDAASKGLVVGVGDGLYSPNGVVSRAEFVQMITNAIYVPSYTSTTYNDVSEGNWYYDAISKAESAGFLGDFDNNTFNPNAPITREEMASILSGAIEYKNSSANASDNLSRFTDAYTIDSQYVDDVQHVVGLGIMNGTGDGNFNPEGLSSRAQSATVIVNTLKTLGLID